MPSYTIRRLQRLGAATVLSIVTVLPLPVQRSGPTIEGKVPVFKDMDGSESLPKVIEMELDETVLDGTGQQPAISVESFRVPLGRIAPEAHDLQVRIHGQPGSLYVLFAELDGLALLLQVGRLDAAGEAFFQLPLPRHVLRQLPLDGALHVLMRP